MFCYTRICISISLFFNAKKWRAKSVTRPIARNKQESSAETVDFVVYPFQITFNSDLIEGFDFAHFFLCIRISDVLFVCFLFVGSWLDYFLFNLSRLVSTFPLVFVFTHSRAADELGIFD